MIFFLPEKAMKCKIYKYIILVAKKEEHAHKNYYQTNLSTWVEKNIVGKALGKKGTRGMNLRGNRSTNRTNLRLSILFQVRAAHKVINVDASSTIRAQTAIFDALKDCERHWSSDGGFEQSDLFISELDTHSGEA